MKIVYALLWWTPVFLNTGGWRLAIAITGTLLALFFNGLILYALAPAS